MKNHSDESYNTDPPEGPPTGGGLAQLVKIKILLLECCVSSRWFKEALKRYSRCFAAVALCEAIVDINEKIIKGVMK
jgi:hypothetical protein